MSKRVSVRNSIDWTTFSGPTLVESYLKKKKIKSMNRKTGKKTTLRYFIFDLTENTFLYKDSETTPEIKVIHIGKDLKAFSEKLDDEEKNICDWPYGFKIFTTIKNYTLYAKSSDIYMRWIEVLKNYFKKLALMQLNESPTLKKQQSKIAMEETKNNKKPEENKNKENLNNRGNTPGRFSKLIEETYQGEFIKNIQKNTQNKIETTNNLNFNNVPTTKDIFEKNPNNNKNNFQRQSFTVNLPAHILHQGGTHPDMQERILYPFKGDDSKPNFSKPVVSLNGDDLRKNSFHKWPGDTNYQNELDEFFENSPKHRNDYLNPEQSANQIGHEYQKMNYNNGDNLRKNLSKNPRSDDGRINESKNNLYKKSSKLNDSRNRNYGPIQLENMTIDKETPNGFELIVRVPTLPKNTSVTNSSNNNENSNFFNMTNDLNFIPSYININNQNSNLVDSHESIYDGEESISKETDHKYVGWDEINQDWTTFISHNKKIQSYIDRNKKQDLVLKEHKPSKNNLYDERNLHIKRSDNQYKFSIETLHYYNEGKTDLNNSSVSDTSEDKFKKNTSFIFRSRKKENKNDEDKPSDITTLSLDGEKVNVKWRLTTKKGNQTAYKIKVPEVLLKDQPSNRNQKMKEMVNEIQHGDSVYIGKNRNTTFEKTLVQHQTVNKTFNYDMTVNYGDKSTNDNIVSKIMKKPTKEQINNNWLYKKPVAGEPITEEYGNDEYHIKITNTIKLHTNTHIYDAYHIPRSEMDDIYHLKDYKIFKNQIQCEPLIDDAPDPGFQKFHNHFNLRANEDDPVKIQKDEIDDNDPESDKNKLRETQEQKNPETENKSDDNNPDDEDPKKSNNFEENANPEEGDGQEKGNESFNNLEVSENYKEEWEEGFDENGNLVRVLVQRRSVVTVNKNIKVIRGVSGIDNDFDLTNLPDDQKVQDLSDIDQYYHNVSRITENSKMDTNENWNSALSEADV